MDLQSLKRVLTELKAEARSMKKEQMGARLKGPPPELEAEGAPEAPAEEVAPEELEAPLAEAAEGDEAPAELGAESEDEMVKAVLRKHGIG